MNLDRRKILAISAAVAALPTNLFAASGLAPDDQDRVDRAVAYLQGIATAKGRFSQTDWRGSVAEGSVYISRPGRARFEYDPPYGLLMVSDGKTVTVTDSRLHTVQKHPLSSTPLGLFLASEVHLDGSVRVLGVGRSVGGFTITAADSRNQGQGQITLGFAENPLRLTGWALTDPQRRTTRVDLTSFAPAGALSPELFIATPVAAAP